MNPELIINCTIQTWSQICKIQTISQMQQRASLIGVNPYSLQDKFGTKKDLHTYMVVQRNVFFTHRNIVGLFLPNQANTSSSFLKQILKNEKRVLKQKDVQVMHVPKYKELSMKHLIGRCLQNQELAAYLPSIESQNDLKHLDREFFFGVVATISGDHLKTLIDEALKQRYGAPGEIGQKNTILISSDWNNQLHQYPFAPSKKGRGIFKLQDRELMKVKRQASSQQVPPLLESRSNANEDIAHHSEALAAHHPALINVPMGEDDRHHASQSIGAQFSQKLQFSI